MDTLSENEKKMIKYEPSDRKFKFGDNTVFTSLYKVLIPAVICSKRVMIGTDVIQTDIPLLLSKEAMRKANTVIHFQKDCVRMFGKPVRLLYTTIGHYCIALNKNVKLAYEENTTTKVYFVNIEKIDTCSYDEKTRFAVKIHKQFGHATGLRLKKLLKDAGVSDKELLKIVEEVCNHCQLCLRYRKSSPKPIVIMPVAKVFNDSVAMDIKDISSKHVLHLIDHATRYSAACVVRSKHRDTIIDNILKIWIPLFGTPRKILSDNGGEFSNEDFLEMGEKLNTTVTTTAAESPWSNGVNERHNGILGEMVLKTMEDSKCSVEKALCWSLAAKNSLANVYGYSPNQLVFGRNPSFPSILHDKLPALNETCSSEILSENLNAMHAARRSFLECESSEKLRRALRAKTRNHAGIKFEMGQSVYYKRDGFKEWKGPGKVIGVDGDTVIVKHGGFIVRVHACRLEHSEFVAEQSRPVAESSGAPSDNTANESDFPTPVCGVNDEYLSNSNNDHNTEESDVSSILHDNNSDLVTDAPHLEEAGGEDNGERSVKERIKILPKVKSSVVAKTDGSNWRQLKVISRAGKRTGKYGNYLNVLDENTKQMECLDWEKVNEWKSIPAEEVLIADTNMDEMLVAKSDEIEKWKEYQVFEEVEDCGQNTISTRWVCTNKDGKLKARLVARGFEEHDLHDRVDSPTCAKNNLRMVIAIGSSKSWRIHSLDVQSAFLQGEDVSEDIFLLPPKELGNGKLWKLKKYVYGLKQASRKWYTRVLKELSNLGVSRSKYDEALFYYQKDGKLEGLIAAHVDDFFWCGSDLFEKEVISVISSIFKISSIYHDSFTFLGLQVNQTDSGITVSQSIYAEEIEPVEYRKCDRNRKLSDKEKRSLRSVIGQLGWLANQTRPDVSYDVCQLSIAYKDARESDLAYGNKVIRKIKNNEMTLKYPKMNLEGTMHVHCHSDASFNNLPNGGSQGAFVILISDEGGNSAPIQWQSKKVCRVVKSTLAAECLAMEDAADSAFYIKNVLMELLSLGPERVLMKCVIDNASLYEALFSSTNVKEDKRLILDISLLKEMYEKEEINSIELVESSRQLADALTKQGASPELLRRVVNSGSVGLVYGKD